MTFTSMFRPTAPLRSQSSPRTSRLARFAKGIIGGLASLAAASSFAATTIDQVLADMYPGSATAPATNQSEVVPKYYEGQTAHDWYYRSGTTQYAPYGIDPFVPSWFPHPRPYLTPSILSWFVAMEGTGNAATNTRIQVANLNVYILRNSNRQWIPVDARNTWNSVDLWTADNIPEFDCYNHFCYTGRQASIRTHSKDPDGSGGGVSFKPAFPYFMHGYGNPQTLGTGTLPAPGNHPGEVRATYVSIDFRLVVDDPSKPDDRANAKYVIDVGGDYWPTDDSKCANDQTKACKNWAAPYAPGFGNGRFRLATTQWQTATLLVPNWAAMGLNEGNWDGAKAEFKNNPPPLTGGTASTTTTTTTTTSSTTTTTSSTTSTTASSGLQIPTTYTHIGAFPAWYVNKCLDVAGASPNNGTAIHTYTCNASYTNQMWKLVNMGNSQYQLRVKQNDQSSDKCLDVPAYSHASGVALQQYACNSNPNNNGNQLWTLMQVSGTQNFQIRSVNTPSLCVDVRGNNTGDSVVVQQYTCSDITSNQQNQLWYFTP